MALHCQDNSYEIFLHEERCTDLSARIISVHCISPLNTVFHTITLRTVFVCISTTINHAKHQRYRDKPANTGWRRAGKAASSGQEWTNNYLGINSIPCLLISRYPLNMLTLAIGYDPVPIISTFGPQSSGRFPRKFPTKIQHSLLYLIRVICPGLR